MIDVAAYPPAFAALLKDFSRDLSGVVARADWDQASKQLITRYTLAACLLSGRDMDLAPILKRSFNQLESIGARVVCSKTYADWQDRILLVGLLAIQEIGAEMKDAETYTRQLTNNVHALYSRAMSRLAFFRDTGNIIERQLTEAWMSGADEMMVLPEDMTAEDNAYIQKLITAERKYLDGFADDIQDAGAEGQGWQQFQNRIGMWVNRIKDVENQARIYFGGKQRLIWRYGPTEHCSDCKSLNGIVAFAEEWQQSGVHPQSRDLKCHGVKCQCTCTPTRKRRTAKALDKIKAIMGSGSSKSFPGHAGIPGHQGGSRPRGSGSYGEMVANDPHAKRNASTVPGERKMPWQMNKDEYEKLPTVYRGEREGSSTSGHVFVTNDKNLASTHGKVNELKVLRGSKIYPDPEIEGQAGKTLSGNQSLARGSAVINYSDMVPNLPYEYWKHE